MKSSLTKKNIKNFFKKFWFIVWKDDSFKGWIISLIFLFVVIKLIFFPLLSLTTGTALPLVIVESCSMYHENNLFSNFDNWWEEHDMKYFKLKLTEFDWAEFPFKKGFNKGDILFITGIKPEKIKNGDVIIFNANHRNPIIHRVISIDKEGNEYIFSTIGDNNNGQIDFEKRILETQIVGKATANIAPYLGWIKLIFFERLKYPTERGFCK
jgi:signal peptidase I